MNKLAIKTLLIIILVLSIVLVIGILPFIYSSYIKCKPLICDSLSASDIEYIQREFGIELSSDELISKIRYYPDNDCYTIEINNVEDIRGFLIDVLHLKVHNDEIMQIEEYFADSDDGLVYLNIENEKVKGYELRHENYFENNMLKSVGIYYNNSSYCVDITKYINNFDLELEWN